MPISQITWPTNGHVRVDVFHNPYIDRFNGNDRAVTAFWKDESSYLQWNLDPFEFGCDDPLLVRANCGSGRNEFPGTLYLLPYWMARFEDIIN